MTIDVNPCVTCAHKESRPNGNPCWKCIEFDLNGKIFISAKFYKKQTITNADRIRSMSDEELAIMASTMYRTQELIGGDVKTWLAWLKQECDDNGT